MSRVRFHSMAAIERHPEVTLRTTGPGFPHFHILNEIDEFKPDWVVWYKPLDIPGYQDVKVNKCIRYNEMWDVDWTTREIEESKSDLVICHHLNDMPNYRHFKIAKLVNISHCAEKTIFKNYDEEKIYDLLLIGSLRPDVYPLRDRFKFLIQNYLSKKYKCKILEHPGYEISNVDEQVIHYAREINRSKIVLTCSSKYKYALAKYAEVGLCGSLLCADIPGERQEWYKKWVVQIELSDTDEQIINKLEYYLKHDEEREKRIEVGFKLNKEYTQEKYAERFVAVLKHLEFRD